MLGYWGFQTARGTLVRLGTELGAPLLPAAARALFVSLNAPLLARWLLYLALETAVLGLAVVALYATGHPRLALACALVALASRVLKAIWGQ